MRKNSKVNKLKMIELRLQYKTMEEIANYFNVSRTLIGLYLKEIYNNGDLELRNKLDDVRDYLKFNRKNKISVSKMNGYELGILWSIGSWIKSEEVFVLKHRNKYFLKQIEKYTNNTIYKQVARTGVQYVLSIYGFDINELIKFGWNMRNDDIRNIPVLDDYRDFIRAYIELHGYLDYSVRYKRKDKSVKYKGLRLRIYGNFKLMNSLNNILSKECGVRLKTVQGLGSYDNGKTSYLQYVSFEEIRKIYNWVFDVRCCEEYWNDVERKMRKPVIWE